MMFFPQYSRAMRPFTFSMTTVNLMSGLGLYFHNNAFEISEMIKNHQYQYGKKFDLDISRIFFFSFFKAQIYKYTAPVSIPIMAYDMYTGKEFERHFVPGSIHGYLWK